MTSRGQKVQSKNTKAKRLLQELRKTTGMTTSKRKRAAGASDWLQRVAQTRDQENQRFLMEREKAVRLIIDHGQQLLDLLDQDSGLAENLFLLYDDCCKREEKRRLKEAKVRATKKKAVRKVTEAIVATQVENRREWRPWEPLSRLSTATVADLSLPSTDSDCFTRPDAETDGEDWQSIRSSVSANSCPISMDSLEADIGGSSEQGSVVVISAEDRARELEAFINFRNWLQFLCIVCKACD